MEKNPKKKNVIPESTLLSQGYFAYPVTDWSAYLHLAKSKFNTSYASTVNITRAIDDFVRIRSLGQGAFGRVVLVKDRLNGNYYAMKILSKELIVRYQQIEHTLNEQKILEAIRCPFCVFLEFFFKDNSNLYFGLPFIQGGEMFTALKRFGRFPKQLSQFYAAQVLLALEFLHCLGLVYRDLKPENILINMDGYVKITDFGFCKRLTGRTYTLCGTPEYIAPEIIRSKGYGFSCDWWAFGILLYEISSGQVPFSHPDDTKLYEKVLAGKFRMPSTFPDDLKSLIKSLLEVDVSRRAGCMVNGVRDIKDHEYFEPVVWLDMYNKRIKAPFKPPVKEQGDASNFDPLPDVPLIISTRNKYQKEFEDF